MRATSCRPRNSGKPSPASGSRGPLGIAWAAERIDAVPAEQCRTGYPRRVNVPVDTDAVAVLTKPGYVGVALDDGTLGWFPTSEISPLDASE